MWFQGEGLQTGAGEVLAKGVLGSFQSKLQRPPAALGEVAKRG